MYSMYVFRPDRSVHCAVHTYDEYVSQSLGVRFTDLYLPLGGMTGVGKGCRPGTRAAVMSRGLSNPLASH